MIVKYKIDTICNRLEQLDPKSNSLLVIVNGRQNFDAADPSCYGIELSIREEGLYNILDELGIRIQFVHYTDILKISKFSDAVIEPFDTVLISGDNPSELIGTAKKVINMDPTICPFIEFTEGSNIKMLARKLEQTNLQVLKHQLVYLTKTRRTPRNIEF